MITKTIKINNKEYTVNCFIEDDKTIVELPDELKKLDGYGTALKPAYEPIILCRKPRGKETFVDCALNYGTGSLNVDGTRIGNEQITINGNKNIWVANGRNGNNNPDHITNIGRFPANFGLICECECEPCECIERELDSQSGISKSKGSDYNWSESNNDNSVHVTKNIKSGVHFEDKGGASRFFYTAKSSRKERNLGLDHLPDSIGGGLQGTQDLSMLTGNGNVRNNVMKNNHPTVKPIKLIEYLSKLMLPPTENSSILIPFSGSGSEIIGSMLAGWNVINALEIDENYCNIAESRVQYWKGKTYKEGMKG